MRLLRLLLLGMSLGSGTAAASIDFSGGSLYRSTGAPAWSADSGAFTIMLWIYAPSISGSNNYFMVDDGGAFQVYVNIGSAADSPTEPYFLTRNGEYHFNRDGSYVAKPDQSFDVTLDWTFLAVSFSQGGATDLYARQAGVNNNVLVHIPVHASGSSIGGSGITSNILLGGQSGFGIGCKCLEGPVYVYNGSALWQVQIDAQRQQLAPVTNNNLIAFSTFMDDATLTVDQSGTANWSTHGTVRYVSANPSLSTSAGGGTSGGTTGSGSAGNSAGDGGASTAANGSGAADGVGLLGLLVATLLRQRLRRRRRRRPD